MRVLALNASPNRDGLTASCAAAFLAGAEEAGANVKLIHLKDHTLHVCQMCGNGWGLCRQEARCVIEDDFEQIRREILDADAWALATPVYYGDLSEGAKLLMDRLRRCNTGDAGGQLAGKSFVGIAAAGGSGRGTGSCCENLERMAMHTSMKVADLIPITRRSKLYRIDCIKNAGRAIVEQPWNE